MKSSVANPSRLLHHRIRHVAIGPGGVVLLEQRKKPPCGTRKPDCGTRRRAHGDRLPPSAPVVRITLVGEAASLADHPLLQAGGHRSALRWMRHHVRNGQLIASGHAPNSILVSQRGCRLENKQRLPKRSQELNAKGFFQQALTMPRPTSPWNLEGCRAAHASGIVRCAHLSPAW
jgi:hypothetical protein